MLNAALDRDGLAEKYRRDQRIAIDNVLQEDVAERVRAICSSRTPFDFAYALDGSNRVASLQEMAELDAATKAELSKSLLQEATKGLGFLYCRYGVKRDTPVTDPDLKFLHEVVEYLNSIEMLDFVKHVSGRNDVVSADAQYTRYSAGQYLTRHRDVVDDPPRRLAYVLGFTRDWHPDWGGLLQFYEDNGTPRDAWAPAFNRLVLFDVRHVHAVTYVTPFAGAARLSLTGWYYAEQ